MECVLNNLTKNNHYVPQFYLKNFSLDGKKLFVYRTLVPNNNFPVWKSYSIRSVAMQTHLYTSIINGRESDEFEIFFEREYETPVQIAYEKAINGRKLNKEDWTYLIRFIASQIVRTPYAYIKHVGFMEKTAIKIFEETIPKTMNKIKKAINDNNFDSFKHAEISQDLLDLPIVVETDKEKGQIKTEIEIGRNSWLNSAKYILNKHLPVLLSHEWSIVDIHPEVNLFTSDNPVVCLNYYSESKYDFGGGWSSKGSEIIFPLSSNKLVYTKIGGYVKSRVKFNKEISNRVRKIIAENSYRYIYSKSPEKYMKALKPRNVNREQFLNERKAWSNWHYNQN